MTTPSWDFKSGIVSFSFDFQEDLTAPVGVRMEHAIRSLLTLLDPVAQPTQARVGTLMNGEDAACFELPKMQDALLAMISASHDITDVAVDCNLQCVAPDGSLFAITQAMTVWVSRESLDDARESCPLQMQISLDVDIYVAVHDERRDNREFARINAPLFNEFLQRLQGSLHAALTDVDACYHEPGLVTRNGFANV